ncbi:MAG: c-type cytochrome [Betaproteobacteria bacterium]|nr:c-type cytochrome [Betaproteobacteria bacterium]
MIKPFRLDARRGGNGIYRGIAHSFLLVVLFAGNVLAESPVPASQTMKFEDFELELPTGLNREDFYLPPDNPINKDKVALGRSLFFDPRLSSDNTVSCASCHSPQAAFSDKRQVSLGVGLQAGDRNAPTIINRAFSRGQFWDGRTNSLEEQSKAPLINPREMAMPSHELLVKKLGDIRGYKSWFKRVFARDVNIDDLAKAIAAFERTVVSGNAKYDVFKAGNQQALNQAEKRGLALFEGKARCSQCHSGPNFTDEKYHNIGVGWDATLVDLGRYKVTHNEQDIGAFKTPTLREIAGTAPYMHNGAFATLEETVAFYNMGGIANPFLDVEMRRPKLTLEQMLEYYEKRNDPGKPSPDTELTKLELTKGEQADLVAFLKTLSGQGWQHITPPDSFPE